MSEGNGVAALSNKHEMIMNWMLMNPDKSLRECADQFGITQSWLSTLIHSDIFQAQLAERHEGIRAKIADTIPQKMRTAADVGIQKLTEKLEQTEDADFILDATDKLLHRLGYAPARQAGAGAAIGIGSAQNVQNNFYVSAADLAKARDVMGQVGPRPAGALDRPVELAPQGDTPASPELLPGELQP